MADFEFEKCGDVLIKLDCKLLGAVTDAECTSENSYSDISQFLTDIPVCRIPESKYKIRLSMTLNGENPFWDKASFEQVELIMKNRTVRYSDCFVESAKTAVGARGFVQAQVVMSAQKREIV